MGVEYVELALGNVIIIIIIIIIWRSHGSE